MVLYIPSVQFEKALLDMLGFSFVIHIKKCLSMEWHKGEQMMTHFSFWFVVWKI